MAFSLLPLASPQPPHLHLPHKTLPRPPLSLPTNPFTSLRTKRGQLAVAKAGGPPSSTSLILAFVLPLSLFAGTVFAAVRVADDLEEKFLEDLAMNRAVMEENEGGEAGEGDAADDHQTVVLEEEVAAAAANAVPHEDRTVVLEEEVAAAANAVPRVRNRPRREV